MHSPRYHPFVRLLFCALGLFVASLVIGIMLFVGSAVATVWTGRPPGAQLADVTQRYALQLTLFSYPAMVLWVSYCRTHLDRFSLLSLGLRARRAVPDMGRGALTGALAISLLWLILWLTGAIGVEGWSSDVREGTATTVLLSMAGYVVVFLAVASFEELLFRGYILHNLNDWLGWKGALWVQAVIFAAIHLGNVVGGPPAAQAAALGAMPSLVLIAVFFALCYRKTGSLWFPIGFHFAWNFCLGTVFSLPVSGFTTFRLLEVKVNETLWLSGGSFGAEGSLVLLPILLALIYYIAGAPDHPQALLDLGLFKREEVPAPLPAAPAPIEDETEVERENRFRTKFGTSQGFSADTLRELRDLQEAREKAARDAEEAAKREQLVVSSFGASAAPSPAVPEAAAVEERAPGVAIPEAPVVVVVAPAPIVSTPKPVPPAPVVTTPQAPAPPAPKPSPPTGDVPVKKKPPSPRW